jgi:hypothetical protein
MLNVLDDGCRVYAFKIERVVQESVRDRSVVGRISLGGSHHTRQLLQGRACLEPPVQQLPTINDGEYKQISYHTRTKVFYITFALVLP